MQLDGPGTFSGRTENGGPFVSDVRDLRDRNDVFDGPGGRFGSSATLTPRGQAERVESRLSRATPSRSWAFTPVLGRAIHADDDRDARRRTRWSC